MIVSAPIDYRETARRKLPPFLFDYLDGAAGGEATLRANLEDLSFIPLRQRVLRNADKLSLHVDLFGERLAQPVILGPVGLCGMYARRGEVQAAQAAKEAGIPFTLSTVSVCSLREVIDAVGAPTWFQLYVLKDRGFMKDALQRAAALGVSKLVFTVDMPTPGPRYRDARSGMSGPYAGARRLVQAICHPSWVLDVGLLGQPHDLGNISAYRGRRTGLVDYIGWLKANFDPSISWADLEWIRDTWKGTIIIKGIMDADDARDAARFGADGIVVSNHGGRQLDGTISTTRALPAIADAVGDRLTVLVDSGIRSGLDVVRMLALGAKGVLLGRAYIYALASTGKTGVAHLLSMIEAEIRTVMTLTGAASIQDCSRTLFT
jgi:L-lactate dehydrogenase (cytochrome)